ncbi:MAG: T9SS type A sorting domain-containing protein [Bacteroidota bacterium]
MKRKHLLNTLLFTAVAGLGYVTFSSSASGAGNNSGYDCTGAETGLGNGVGCGHGCHNSSATAGITVALELDSAGTPVTQYVGGMTYTIKITGTNTTANSLPKFGFQVAVINGTSAQTTPTNAGTFQTVSNPMRNTAAQAGNFVTNLVEQKTAIAATTGTGGSGTTYVESFSWTAPAAGSGSISIWGVLNAVDGFGTNSGDFWNSNNITITEETAGTSCATVTGLSASATGSTTGNATWTFPTGVTACEWAINTTGTAPSAGPVTTTASHSFTGLTPSTLYHVFVRDSCGAGSFSAWSSTTFTTQPSGVNNIATGNFEISAFPNPVVNNLQVKIENTVNGTYTVNMYDITGKKIYTQNVEVSNNTFATNINTGNFANGMYALQIVKDGAQRTISILKH